MQTIAITGAAGRIGSTLRPLLARDDRELVLIDESPIDDLTSSERFAFAEVTNERAMVEALAGADMLVHLAGIPSETNWSDLAETNIHGTQVALEAARHAQLRRILLASSIHAVGMAPLADVVGTRTLLPRPDGYYGMTKAAVEALGSLYADRYDLSIVSARICAFGDHPIDANGRVHWFSPADMARLVEAAAALNRPGHHIVWGISADGAELFGIDDDQGIGFVPRDRLDEPLGEDEVPWNAPIGGIATADDRLPGMPW
jgi:nucleoside-diphosphate-sugar epimerase